MASGWISKSARQQIYKRDQLVCVYCGCTCVQGESNSLQCATLDHIVSQKELASVAMDDRHFGQLRRDPKNLVVACMRCNSIKKHYTVYEFCKRMGFDYAAILERIADRIQRPLR